MRPLRYAILHHSDIDEPHYDLLFETLPGSQLTTWRSPVWPIEGRAQLTRLKDHRRLYLDYEGDLPGHRGRVHRYAHGECEIEIGENAVWTIRLVNGSIPITLSIRQIQDEQWECTIIT
ncbi:MAG TPA: hypothetical protein VFE47_05020 [Tepidisphaeraceae bacterium]|nr:hypothetical protein [Tepidisphaeraceae bacterium]